jgi:hypothetical protein
MTEDEKKEKIALIHELLEASEQSAILLGGGESGDPTEAYAEAILGIIWQPRLSVAYSRSGVLKALMEINDWDPETAEEWFEYNTVRGIQYLRAEDNPPTIVDDYLT